MKSLCSNNFCNKGVVKYVTRLAYLWFCFLAVSTAQALPFPMLDARTAAMGGASISHGIRNSAFYNPALAALEPEGYDWYILLPGEGEFKSDADSLSNIGDDVYQEYKYDVIQITIPTPFLGGSAYIAEYDFHTAKVLNGADLSHRAISVFETGVSVAQLQDVLWAENVLMGATIKLMILESYGYQEPLASAGFDLDSDELERDSVLTLDFGMSKEYGVWKTAFVAKNLYSRDHKYGKSNEKYKIEPQLRAGVAYQSRRSVVEFDLDLLKNEGVGYASDTMFASLGWEWSVFRAFDLRFGFQQNFAGDKNSTFSAGFGLQMWSLLLDFSASVDPDGSGSYLQASWEF